MENLWENCKQALRKNIGDISVDTWIAPLHPKKIDGAGIILEAPDGFFKNWVESNYLDQIKQSFKDLFQKDVEVTFEVNTTLLKSRTNKVLKDINKTFQPASPDSFRLNPRFTLDNFVVGASNRMAHAASVAITDAPGKAYNPLFIYGRVGLGKTHLMQAIAHAMFLKNSQTSLS